MTKFPTGSIFRFLFGTLLFPFALSAQNTPLTCSDLKNGIFYGYPKTMEGNYTAIREGDLQREYEANDSMLWVVKWKDDCTYSMKYISSNKQMSKEILAFLKKHTLVYRIDSVTTDYYTFKGYVDNISGTLIQSDTLWFHEKTNVVHNELFKVIDAASLKKAHFSDTSKYAVVYFYRPGKLTLSLSSYPIYFDDNLIFFAKNKSGHIFKILKEGKIQVKSKLLKDQSFVNLDVKFGQVYYVKSMIHWGITSRLYNFILEMAIVKSEDGKREFEEVNYQ